MHNFQSILKAQQNIVTQIKEANRGKENVKEGFQEKSDQGSDEAKQEET